MIARVPEPGAAAPSAPDPKQHRLREAAHQFEAMLLSRVLQSLERTTQMGQKPAQGGSSQYGSMLVEAISDAIARADGIGLAREVERGVTAQAGVPRR